MQRALLHGPGKSCAVLSLQRADGRGNHDVLTTAAAIIRLAETGPLPENLHILVAVGHDVLLDHARYERENRSEARAALADVRQRWPAVPASSPDLFVQVAADSETDRTDAIGRIATLVAGTLRFLPTLSGHKILNGLEHFGFKDGFSTRPNGQPGAVTQDDKRAALAPNAAVDGTAETLATTDLGSWLLYLRFDQEVDRFRSLPANERTRIMGRAPAELGPPHAILPDPDSHYARMALGNPLRLLRRGFPFRAEAMAGLAFIGVSREPGVLRDALSRLLGTSGTRGGDPLLDYISAVEGGVYFCPPNAEWLDDGRLPSVGPPNVHAIRRTTTPLASYDVANSFVTYMLTLRAAGIFEGLVGDMRIAKDVQPHLDAIYEVLAARSGTTAAEFRQLQEIAQRDANELNRSVNDYYTVS